MEFIKRYWDSQGKTHGSAADASWADHGCIALEVRTLIDVLPRQARLLDVGCANGHATFRIAEAVDPAEMVGVDYSEPMIAAARTRLEKDGARRPLRFEVADVKALPFPDGAFDAVYCTRVLINLPNWEEQKKGLQEMMRVCRSGGRVVLLEAFHEPLMRLNAARLAAGLKPLAEHDFNRYLKEDRLSAFLEEKGVAWSIRPFAGIYYVGTRLLRELLIGERIEGFDSPFHDAFRALDERYDAGAFSVQQAVVIDLL